jgi:hypothetical protein
MVVSLAWLAFVENSEVMGMGQKLRLMLRESFVCDGQRRWEHRMRERFMTYGVDNPCGVLKLECR